MGGFSTGCLVHGICLVEILWLALAGPFLSFLSQTGIERLLCLCRGSIFGTADSFQLREAVTNWRALTIVSPLMSGWGRGHESSET